MFSDALRIMDQNAIEYMVDELKARLAEKDSELAKQKVELAEQKAELERLRALLRNNGEKE